MKILLAAFGSYGDVRPFVVMAKALEKLGQETLLIANPHFESRVRSQGVGFLPAGTEEDYLAAAVPAAATGNRIMDQKERIAASRRLFTRMFLNPSRETFDAISEHREGSPAVFGHFYAYGARLAAEKFGLPYVNVCLSPHWLKGFVRPGGLAPAMQRLSAASAARFIDGQLFTRPFNELRASAGLGPMSQSSVRWMFGGDNLCLFPEWFLDFRLEDGMAAECVGFPLQREEGGELPEHVDEFLEKHREPILFTPGSAVTDAAAFFRAALEALAALGRPGIFLSPAAALPESLSEDVLRADFLPLGLLLHRCAAVVHHGGIGTAAQAMAAGAPQLVCPRMDEQRENARILKKLGVCETLPYSGLTGRRMAEALGRLLGDPATKQKCREISQRPLEMPSEFLQGYLARLRQRPAK